MRIDVTWYMLSWWSSENSSQVPPELLVNQSGNRRLISRCDLWSFRFLPPPSVENASDSLGSLLPTSLKAKMYTWYLVPHFSPRIMWVFTLPSATVSWDFQSSEFERKNTRYPIPYLLWSSLWCEWSKWRGMGDRENENHHLYTESSCWDRVSVKMTWNGMMVSFFFCHHHFLRFSPLFVNYYLQKWWDMMITIWNDDSMAWTDTPVDGKEERELTIDRRRILRKSPS